MLRGCPAGEEPACLEVGTLCFLLSCLGFLGGGRAQGISCASHQVDTEPLVAAWDTVGDSMQRPLQMRAVL